MNKLQQWESEWRGDIKRLLSIISCSKEQGLLCPVANDQGSKFFRVASITGLVTWFSCSNHGSVRQHSYLLTLLVGDGCGT